MGETVEELEEDPYDDTWHAYTGDKSQIWNPEGEINEEPIIFSEALRKLPKIPKLKATQYTRFAFWMPAEDGGLGEDGQGYSRFSFTGRRHLTRIYDSPCKRILLICGRQVEKTVRVHSGILLADGTRREAGDIVIGDEVATLDISDGGSKMTTGRVSWVSHRYIKPCVRIQTRQGHACEVATTHPMRVWDDWLEAGEVAKGARLAVVRRSGVFFDESMPPERVKLTAYMIGDGHIGKYLSFTTLPGVKLLDFVESLNATGVTYKIEPKKNTRAVAVRVHVGVLHQWLEADGLQGVRSATKFVPFWVFQLSKEQTALFLNRLWATDGHVKQHSRSRYSIEYCSVSPQLIRDVQALLWKFGIPSRVRKNWPNYHKKRGVEKFAHILRVETQDGVRRFIQEIGALGKCVNIEVPAVVMNNNRDTYPVEVNAFIKRIIDTRGSEGRRGGQAEGSLRSAGLRETLRYPPSRDKLKRYVHFFHLDERYNQQLTDELKKHLDTDVYWDEAISVEPIGGQECIDFKVESTHNFVVDGFITHNSTMLGNKALCYMSLVPAFRLLYVSPSATQTTTFSNDRIKEPIETSPILKRFTTQMLAKNILEKQFVNRSKITLRYAFLNADRTRGIPADMLEIDEFQDVFSDNIPVIEQCLAHARPQWRVYLYAGTPKSLDNNIEYLRVNSSTQGEWVIPHECKSGEAGRHWNILGEKNIGRKGLICEHCGKLMDPAHADAQWAAMAKWDPVKVPFESYRISQLMVPWKPWNEILIQYEKYPRDKFYNEVLGISYDSGLRPLTRAQVQACCRQDLSMSSIESYRQLGYNQPVFAGIDWGCHDEDTRILTDGGFKYFKDLIDDDKVAQWDPDTRTMDFVVPKARTVKDWDGELLHFETKGGVDLMVTDTHRMRVGVQQGERWLTESAGELVGRGGNVKFVGHVDWHGQDIGWVEIPGLPKSSGYSGCGAKEFRGDDFIEFFGYMVTEGGVCLKKNKAGELTPYCLKMSQRASVSPDRYEKIRECMVRLGIPFSEFPNPKTGDVNWTICGKQYWKWFSENMGMTGDAKRLPRWLLMVSKRQLRILFNAMLLGDGYIDPRDGCTGGAYYSTSKGLCEDFQEICIKLGLRCVVRLHKPAAGNRKARWRALWSAGRDYQFNTPSRKVERVPYKGKVYCCAVPSGYIVTERNGCVSYQGNTGENAYTVITLATYVDMKFRVFFWHRFVGEETDPDVQINRIIELVKYFNVNIIGTDYGGGYDRNHRLVREFGPRRVFTFQYMARSHKKIWWDGKMVPPRFKAARTEVMSDIFNAIKRLQCEFPRWEEMMDPYAMDMTNIYSEYNETIRQIQYKHSQDKPDDSFHSLVYCWLVSMMMIRRPDIISPTREIDGKSVSDWSGPVDQDRF